VTMRKAAAAKYVGITQDALDFHLLMGNVESRVEKDRFGECQVFEKNALDALKRLIEERRYIQVEIDRLDGDLKSLDEGARAEAIRSLLRLGDPLILPLLLRELFGVQAHKLLFVEAEETLVRMGAPAAIMLSRWRDDDGQRGDLARAVLDRIRPEGVGDKIARRAAKLAGLGVTANPLWCVLKLLEIPDPRIIAPLFDSFDDRWGNQLPFMAEDAFARLGERAVGPLLAALGHTHPRARALASAALGRIGDARALGPLIVALADEELVRASAAAALAYFSDRRAAEALLASLRDPAPGVRAAAASALWRAHDARVRAALQTATQDPDAFVRQSAAYALKNPGRGPREIEPLLAALIADRQEVRGPAVEALARTLDPRAYVRLRCTAGFSHAGPQYTFAAVLAAFNDPRAAEARADAEWIEERG
jgi:HEAT repeat protein